MVGLEWMQNPLRLVFQAREGKGCGGEKAKNTPPSHEHHKRSPKKIKENKKKLFNIEKIPTWW
jgi:hypothetical protein